MFIEFIKIHMYTKELDSLVRIRAAENNKHDIHHSVLKYLLIQKINFQIKTLDGVN